MLRSRTKNERQVTAILLKKFSVSASANEGYNLVCFGALKVDR